MLLAIHHFEHDANIFDTEEVSLKFLLEIMTPVSTVSVTLSDKVFTLGDGSFIVRYEKVRVLELTLGKTIPFCV